MSSKHIARPTNSIGSFLVDAAWFSFKLTFGLASLATVWTTAILKNGALWATDTEEEKRELATAQGKHWSLDREPLSGFKHAFFKTRLGTSLHYVINADNGASTPKNIAVFIHGFPDSFLLWRHILQSPELQHDYVLIAVDLPGYGGSDSLPSYGPYEMLEAITEFILGIREQYLHTESKAVVVTHDWGALVGARLASEASELADQWIITSGMIPLLAQSNAIAQFTLAKQMIHTWVRSPFNLRLLKTAAAALGPVRSQFRRSFYIFCFHLPWPFTNLLATFGNYWFLRVMHNLGKGTRRRNEDKLFGHLDAKEAGEAMAMSTGPGIQQLNESEFGAMKYGESVRRRVRDRGMSEKVKIYRDGLFNRRWEKSLETTAALFEIATSSTPHSSASSAPLLSGQLKGCLKAPTTFMLGERDPAFDRRLALDNVKDYLVGGSQVVLIKGAGHWLPLEPAGRRILEKTVLWALSKELGSENVSTPFASMNEVTVVVET
ncbi:alpha/beta-hydrolase [Ophiobolus disseminans]|uniref:Alpha/beta-hydrolase n=1 Tax=Ophiobolus disseminans TaxID=1469910 RepID=A0A6A6ZUG3_9PLEO|nr:alpha/beta-hydrolase [Ophiobolus disseminans]